MRLDNATPKGVSRKRMDRDTANARAMELAASDPDFVRNPSVRKWAQEIGCSTGLVTNLPFWIRTMELTGRGRKDKAKTSAVQSFSKEMESTAVADTELQRLVDEQHSDYEPSPLDENPSVKSVKVRKRL